MRRWRRAASIVLRGVLVWWVVERTVRWWLIRRFFQRASASPARTVRTVLTVVQPILSGDPHLADTLHANARLETALPVRWAWMVDHDDLPGRQLTGGPARRTRRGTPGPAGADHADPDAARAGRN